MDGTFDIFNVMCKQHHGTALNSFLNGTKNSEVDGTFKLGFTVPDIGNEIPRNGIRPMANDNKSENSDLNLQLHERLFKIVSVLLKDDNDYPNYNFFFTIFQNPILRSSSFFIVNK